MYGDQISDDDRDLREFWHVCPLTPSRRPLGVMPLSTLRWLAASQAACLLTGGSEWIINQERSKERSGPP
jgi:hypothetical protein